MVASIDGHGRAGQTLVAGEAKRRGQVARQSVSSQLGFLQSAASVRDHHMFVITLTDEEGCVCHCISAGAQSSSLPP